MEQREVPGRRKGFGAAAEAGKENKGVEMSADEGGPEGERWICRWGVVGTSHPGVDRWMVVVAVVDLVFRHANMGIVVMGWLEEMRSFSSSGCCCWRGAGRTSEKRKLGSANCRRRDRP